MWNKLFSDCLLPLHIPLYDNNIDIYYIPGVTQNVDYRFSEPTYLYIYSVAWQTPRIV